MGFNSGSTSLKFFKRLNLYKNSTDTVRFNPETFEGRSYNWTFLAPIAGKLVFNDYNWSITTSCHQGAVSALLRELKIPYIRVDGGHTSPRNFTRGTVEELYLKYFELCFEAESSRQGTGVAHRRQHNAKEMLENIEKLESISKKFKVPERTKRKIFEKVELDFYMALHEKYAEKCLKYWHLKTAASDFKTVEL